MEYHFLIQLYREDKLRTTEAMEKIIIHKTDVPDFLKNKRKIAQPKAMEYILNSMP